MNKQEFIAKQKRSAEIYRNAIDIMNAKIITLLDGKPEKSVNEETGMNVYHEKTAEIKKLRYDISKVEVSLRQCLQTIKDAE